MSVDPSALSSFASAPDQEPGPSRKRARTEVSPEQRKEARAHRNRIAAQNSRDRRKAQFTYLERRVAELEEENRSLRAGMGLPPSLPPSATSRLAEEDKEFERQRAQERENEELKERIRTLEKGWDAVMKALAAQGFSAPGAQPPTPTSITTTSPSESLSRSTSPAEPAPSGGLSPAAPIKSEPSPPLNTSFPLSPAPSHMSLDFESSPSPIFSQLPSPIIKADQVLEHDSTRHLARMATTGGLASLDLPLRLDSVGAQNQSSPTDPIDEAAMERLLREILATSPSIETHDLPLMDGSASKKAPTSPSSAEAEMTILPTLKLVNFDVDSKALGLVDGVEQLESLGTSWVNDADMRRMLESMLPVVSTTLEDSTLPELDLGWDLESLSNNTGMVGINAF
ncbi:hypothetical protein AX14_009406 [Amanita brunnescens Koide BX004]|nr:hypothetical protein AX14_009406 [Amanita brunnescens Koide BX004]